jgi:hypothetical protein
MAFSGMFKNQNDCSHYASPDGTSAAQISPVDSDAPTDLDAFLK